MSDCQYSINQLLTQLTTSFSHSKTARLDAELLICYCLDKPRSYLYTYPELTLTNAQYDQLIKLANRRIQHEPIAYITGSCYFWTFKLKVNKFTLIPRPETELLVEKTLELSKQTNLQVADLGTGTGAIAMALASERASWNITAIEKNTEAIKIAQQNISNHNLKNINLVMSDWATALSANSMDIIVSNPPYIVDNDIHLNQGDVAYEPKHALVADNNGLEDITTIISQAQYALKKGGWLLIEHGYNQADDVQIVMQNNQFTNISSYPDLELQDRITVGQKGGVANGYIQQ